ncbi:MAG: hypothetical protein ACD_68C00043G0005 [uncultured bacterium]|nr:MAG: hypothetical protein ACD_68C00043G0005 [uncultured bacterium]
MTKKIEFNFAKDYAELEKITAEFEQEDIDLDEGLKKFERGLELAAKLKSKLVETENKIKVIKAKFGQEKNSVAEE